MTTKITQGDLLKQDDVDAIVNTVNCVGVMGKGIALQFKNKWPANFDEYQAACKASKVRPGQMLVHDSGGLVKPNYIVNFPTKDHWRGASKIAYIRDGLVDLVSQVKRLGIRSIAIPPLGCGNGGLDWNEVRPLIESAFAALPDVEVRLFEPSGAPDPKTMEVRSKRPIMTAGRAAILKVLDTYRGLGYGLSKIEVQEACLFFAGSRGTAQAAIRQAPIWALCRYLAARVEYHGRAFHSWTWQKAVSWKRKLSQWLTCATRRRRIQFILEHGNAELVQRKVERVGHLIEGFQSSYGMELLASVHWVATHDEHADTMDDALLAVRNWNQRKHALMQPTHVAAAWNRLQTEGWLP